MAPELDRESAITATYRYILHRLTITVLHLLLPENYVTGSNRPALPKWIYKSNDMKISCHGQPTATLRMASISNGKAFVLRPKQPFTLTAAPDGTFPLQLHQPPQKSTPLQERKYSMPKQNTSVPPAEKTVTASEKRPKQQGRKWAANPKFVNNFSFTLKLHHYDLRYCRKTQRSTGNCPCIGCHTKARRIPRRQRICRSMNVGPSGLTCPSCRLWVYPCRSGDAADYSCSL